MMFIVHQTNSRGAVNTVPFRSLYDALLWAKKEQQWHAVNVQCWDNGIVRDIKP